MNNKVISHIVNCINNWDLLKLRNGELTPVAEAFGLEATDVARLPQYIRAIMARTVYEASL